MCSGGTKKPLLGNQFPCIVFFQQLLLLLFILPSLSTCNTLACLRSRPPPARPPMDGRTDGQRRSLFPLSTRTHTQSTAAAAPLIQITPAFFFFFARQVYYTHTLLLRNSLGASSQGGGGGGSSSSPGAECIKVRRRRPGHAKCQRDTKLESSITNSARTMRQIMLGVAGRSGGRCAQIVPLVCRWEDFNRGDNTGRERRPTKAWKEQKGACARR